MKNAFLTLSPSRKSGFESVGFIPLSEIEAYIRIFEISDKQEFIYLIQAMDSLYVEKIEAKIKSKSKNKSGSKSKY